MTQIDELRHATATMTAPAMLRHLLLERFPGGCAVTSSLRARSIVVLKMIADIDRATPVIFCHAPYIYPDSVEYRAHIVRLLDLADVRDPETNGSGPRTGEKEHHELIRSDVPGGGTLDSVVHLNDALSGFEFWVSAAYHRPYSEVPAERLTEEGGLIRADPLRGWTQEEVHAYMAEHDLPHHPRILAPTYHY